VEALSNCVCLTVSFTVCSAGDCLSQNCDTALVASDGYGFCVVHDCHDNIHNGLEVSGEAMFGPHGSHCCWWCFCQSDIDCGGMCDACLAGHKCQEPQDCVSFVCSSGICQNATCSDNTQYVDSCCAVMRSAAHLQLIMRATLIHDRNQFESDVDCGGPCPPCPNDKSCNDNGDCESGYCLLAEDNESLSEGDESPDVCADRPAAPTTPDETTNTTATTPNGSNATRLR